MVIIPTRNSPAARRSLHAVPDRATALGPKPSRGDYSGCQLLSSAADEAARHLSYARMQDLGGSYFVSEFRASIATGDWAARRAQELGTLCVAAHFRAPNSQRCPSTVPDVLEKPASPLTLGLLDCLLGEGAPQLYPELP